MKPKILVTRAIFPQVIQYLSEHFDVEDNQDDAGYGDAELVQRLQGKAGVGLEGLGVGIEGGQAGEAGGGEPIPYRLAPRAGLFQLITQRHEVSTHWKDKFQIFIQLESDDLANTAFKSILRLKRRLLQKLMEEAMANIKEAEQQQLEEGKMRELLELYLELKNFKLKIDKELGIVIG